MYHILCSSRDIYYLIVINLVMTIKTTQADVMDAYTTKTVKKIHR
jgi:hypothetical protein